MEGNILDYLATTEIKIKLLFYANVFQYYNYHQYAILKRKQMYLTL